MLIYIVIFMVFTFLFFEEVFIMMNNKRRHSRRRWLHLSAKKTLITIVLAVIMVAAISIYGIIIVNASINSGFINKSLNVILNSDYYIIY
jgi:heme/copper-type cytochrome/quinol oxidase subunit 2